MIQSLVEKHYVDAQGNPAGGRTEGIGIEINWQDGPLGRGADRKAPNGAFVEGVILAARGRLEFYQTAQGGKFAHLANDNAIHFLNAALGALELRTKERETRGVEGTHTA